MIKKKQKKNGKEEVWKRRIRGKDGTVQKEEKRDRGWEKGKREKETPSVLDGAGLAKREERQEDTQRGDDGDDVD